MSHLIVDKEIFLPPVAVPVPFPQLNPNKKNENPGIPDFPNGIEAIGAILYIESIIFYAFSQPEAIHYHHPVSSHTVRRQMYSPAWLSDRSSIFIGEGPD